MVDVQQRLLPLAVETEPSVPWLLNLGRTASHFRIHPVKELQREKD